MVFFRNGTTPLDSSAIVSEPPCVGSGSSAPRATPWKLSTASSTAFSCVVVMVSMGWLMCCRSPLWRCATITCPVATFAGVCALGGHEHGGELGEPLTAPLGTGHRRRGERLESVADAGTEVGQVKRVQRRCERRYDDLPARPAPVLVLLAVADGPGRRHAGLPGPDGLRDRV